MEDEKLWEIHQYHQYFYVYYKRLNVDTLILLLLLDLNPIGIYKLTALRR